MSREHGPSPEEMGIKPKNLQELTLEKAQIDQELERIGVDMKNGFSIEGNPDTDEAVAIKGKLGMTLAELSQRRAELLQKRTEVITAQKEQGSLEE